MPNRKLLPIFTFTILLSISPILIAQDTSNINTQLHQAVISGNLQQVQSLISNGANINSTNQLGWTPLHLAIRGNHIDIINYLINSGSNVNAADSSGKTPLHFAVESGLKDIVQQLISKQANINATDQQGDNPLSLAQKIGYTEIANILIENQTSSPQIPNQFQPGNRRGMSEGFPENAGNRRGVNRGNDINNNPINNFPTQIPDMPVNNIEMPSMSPMTETTNAALDSNEIKSRIEKYEGLQAAIDTVADGSSAGMRQWGRTLDDNRDRLIAAVRRQFESEIQFISSTAKEENATKTAEASDELYTTKKTRLRLITTEINDQMDNQSRTTTTTTGSRRTTTTRTNTRGSRGNTNMMIMDTQPVIDTPAPEESQYDLDTENELNTWLNANVSDYNGRIDLFTKVNQQITSDFNGIKQIANSENANKTIAAIDGLLLARQQRYSELQSEFEEEIQKQQETAISNQQEPVNMDLNQMPMDTTTSRGRRGR